MTAHFPKAQLIAAVVVTHNRRAALAQTLTNLLQQPLDQIVIVDNGSSDGTAEWLELQRDPRLTVISTGANLGGAGGFAVGMRRAAELFDPDWTLVMDDDAYPRPGCVARFRTLDTHDWQAIAGAVYRPDGTIAELNRPTFNPVWNPLRLLRGMSGGRRGFHVTDDQYAGAEPVSIDVASFVGLFLSRAAIARVGYPDPDLFIYGDDVIYTLGLRRAGLSICFDPRLAFEHDCGTMAPDGGFRCRPLWKAYYLFRNNVIVCRAAAGPVLFPVAMLYYIIAWSRRARAYPPNERPVYRRLMRRALRDGFFGRRRIHHAEVVALSEVPTAVAQGDLA